MERGENGVTCLNLYHRQFWEAATDRYFKQPSIREACYNDLADFFSGRLPTHSFDVIRSHLHSVTH